MTLPPLFKMNVKNVPIQWSIEVEGNKFRTIEGQVGGKLTTSEWTICFEKNIGKANATTAEEQAIKEAVAKHTKKKELGFSTELSTSGTNWHKPMLAHKWEDYSREVLENNSILYIQPKLDGHRCLIYLKENEIICQSRQGKIITTCDHIKNKLESFFQKNPTTILDGELYNHKVPFEILCGWIRRKEATVECQQIQYHVYDMFGESSFRERLDFLQKNLEASDSIFLVETVILNAEQNEITNIQIQYIEKGYEGIMVRLPHSIYENKRSKSLLKMKTFDDDEFEIVSIEEGLGNRTGLATEAVLKMSDGTRFSAGIIGNDEYATKLFKFRDGVKGMKATVKYQGFTQLGIPRFAKMKTIRFPGF
jgi:DNA ligase-1